MLLHGNFDRTCHRDASHRDEVVATGVSDTGERVHLGVHPDGAAAASVGIPSNPCGIHEMLWRHVETLLAHERGEHVVCMAVRAGDGDLVRSRVGARVDRVGRTAPRIAVQGALRTSIRCSPIEPRRCKPDISRLSSRRSSSSVSMLLSTVANTAGS